MSEKRLLIYDASETKPVGLAWKIGARVFKKHFDVILAVNSWQELLTELDKLKDTKFNEVQFWGHGNPGKLYINGKSSSGTFLFKLREVVFAKSSIWLRVCSFAQGKMGHDAMELMAAATDCTVFAHTYIIGDWAAQSGLVCLHPGALPSWSLEEGRDPATNKLLTSFWTAPRTKSALDIKMPKCPKNGR